MDERAASRRANLELVKKDEHTSSGVVASKLAEGAATTSIGINTGQILDGKYLVGRIVGSGAVGIVFEAKNVELDEKVAIKCLRPEMLVDKAMVGRFAREAKAAAAIKSEYVATVYDVGTTEEGVPYIVMEYLDGKDLAVMVSDSGTIGPRTAVEYALQVCEALAVAHSKGIVHRDIKPENLLLTERAGGMKIIKVLDFGISKTALTGSIFQTELPLVKTVNLMGTPLYMSPEQVRVSDSVDVRSDIWSLGMVIYEILTGQTAFNGSSITEICAAILESPPNPIELHRNDLPSGLVEVIAKCLQKDASKRYQNIAELALALMPFGPKRTRLNVERAVAVLQSSGQVDPSLRVDSTMPPMSSEITLTPIPRAPSIPGSRSSTSGISAVSSGSLPIADSTLSGAHTGQGVAMSAESLDYPVQRKKPTAAILGVIGAILVGGVAIAILAGRSSPAAEKPAETKAAVATTVAAPPVTTAAPATPPPAEPPHAPPAAVTHTAGVAPSPAAAPKAPPAWATAVRGNPHLAPAPKAPPPPPPASSPAAKPKPAAPQGSEPDLGY